MVVMAGGCGALIVVIVRDASAWREESALLVAVTTALFCALTLGAVYKPFVSIEPREAFHVTAVLEVPLTVAVNCCFLPDATLTLNGEMETLMF